MMLGLQPAARRRRGSETRYELG